MDRVEIADGGLLLHDPGFYPAEDADALFAWMSDALPWTREKIRGVPLPRLNAWFADAGLRYAYSGLTHTGGGWLPELDAVRRRVESACETPFNSVLLNLYRDGSDSIGFHTDAEPELGENPAVATVSFGAVREFVLKHKATREKLAYRLGHGSLLVMAGTSQHHWLHGLPKTREPVGPRISLTFRQILGR